MSRTPGIDVSRWQGEINWEMVAAAGYRFAVIRATVGDYYTDPQFCVNWSGARDAGLLVSAYHVVRPDASADSQIDRFFDALGDRKADLPVVLDIEVSGGVSPADITACIRHCLQKVEQMHGRKPIIYTAKWFWNYHVLPSSGWSEYDLWVANYGVSAPSLPAAWSGWKFWQYSEKGDVPGIGTGSTDLDWFAGSYEDLLEYAREVAQPISPLDESHFPPYIFGLHDPGGQDLMVEKHKQGWVLVSQELGADPHGPGGPNYSYLSDQGLGVIARLNHGYGDRGTIPDSSRYDDFAQRCGNFVAGSKGCHIWIIGNEPNVSWERPGGPNGEVITPELYARCYRKCRDNIRSRPGRDKDQVVVAPVCPWNTDTKYPDNPSGDWVKYFRHILDRLVGQCDGIAIHTYSNGYALDFITKDYWQAAAGYTHLRHQFRTYIDFMNAIREDMHNLPVYITETDQKLEWKNEPGSQWVQTAYQEIDRWNSEPANQPIQALILYRWPLVQDEPQWAISTRPHLINDFKAATDHEYRVRLPGISPYRVGWLDIDVPASIVASQMATARLRLKNDGSKTWVTTGAHKVRLGYRWYSPAGQELALADLRTSLPHDVKPGSLVIFEEAKVQAPLTPGEYILRWDMIEEPDTWFWKKSSPREDIRVEVQEPPPEYKVAWLDYSVPDTMLPDTVTTASFKLKNEGSKSWPAEGPNAVHLAYHWFTPNGQLAGCWATFRTILPHNVPPGSEVNLANIIVRSPVGPGQYTLRWDLVEEGIAWFSEEGATPLELAIEVVEGDIPSTPWRARASHNQANVGKAFDSDPDTFWDSEAAQQPGMWYELDLGQIQTVARIRIESPGRGFAVGYILSVSTDRTDWQVVDENPHNWKSIDASFTPRSVRYIKIEQTGSPSWGAHWLVSEITVGLAHP